MRSRDENQVQVPLGLFFKVGLAPKLVASKSKWPSKEFGFPELSSLFSSKYVPEFFLGYTKDALKLFVSLETSRKDIPAKPKMMLDSWRSGDSLEIFIDTRPLAESRTRNRFYHQFVIYPEAIEGIQSKLYHFERDRKPPLINKISPLVTWKEGECSYDISIPWQLLEGDISDTLERKEVVHLGLGFRLNLASSPRMEDLPISFPVSSNILDSMPMLLARCEIKI